MDYSVAGGVGARLAGGYVAKILRGANPADLPILAPDQTELILNLKAARSIG